MHRDGDRVRVQRGDEVVLAEGDYVELLAFGRLWVIDGEQVTELAPSVALQESVLLSRAMDHAAAAGCPVGVREMRSEQGTGALHVTLGRDRERRCTMTVGVYTGQVVHYEGPAPEPEQLTLAVGEERSWKGLDFELQVWEEITGLTQVQLVVSKGGDELNLGAPVFPDDPVFYMEGGAYGHLVRVTGIPGGVVVMLDPLPSRQKLRVDELGFVPAKARSMGCTVPSDAFLYDERRGSALLTFRDAKGEPTCTVVVGLLSGEVVAAAPQR